MNRTTRRPGHPLQVSVVSNNGETLDGMMQYFERAGVAARSTRAIHDPAASVPERTTAVVLFPDDFEGADVIAFLRALRRARRGLLLLVITRHANRYGSVIEADGASSTPLVLPSPCFGWDILDAIRAHAQGTTSQ